RRGRPPREPVLGAPRRVPRGAAPAHRANQRRLIRSNRAETVHEKDKILRRTMRDMVALSALPAAWVKQDPLQIADSLAYIVLTARPLELVYIKAQGIDHEIVELARTRQGKRADAAEIGRALSPILELGATDSGLSVANPIGEDTVRCVRIPIRWETRE